MDACLLDSLSCVIAIFMYFSRVQEYFTTFHRSKSDLPYVMYAIFMIFDYCSVILGIFQC
jgi:hypothetical protein